MEHVWQKYILGIIGNNQEQTQAFKQEYSEEHVHVYHIFKQAYILKRDGQMNNADLCWCGAPNLNLKPT